MTTRTNWEEEFRSRLASALGRELVLRDALAGLLERHCDLVNCGDCGFWNPEDEKEVKAARAALALVHGESQETKP